MDIRASVAETMKNRLWPVTIAICAGLFSVPFCESASAGGPSFDCAKAHSSVEHLICDAPELAELDKKMADAFALALEAPGTDIYELTNSQTTWLRDRDRSCSSRRGVATPDRQDDARACLSALYQSRIEDLRDPTHEAAPYGVYVFHFKPRPNMAAGAYIDVTYAAKLFNSLLYRKGPLRDKVRQVIQSNCPDDESMSCGRLNGPSQGNTITMDSFHGGFTTAGGLLRSFLTWTDNGSASFTEPAIVLDFEIQVEFKEANPGELDGVVTTKLTGMTDFTDARLPHVEGLPQARSR
jgi:uncharacterized protein